uniref:T9SS type A sorting domain-containing protein n=1 Tax=uncultured Polaribacter sp. TaxID=174711 RepID=UPI002636215D|nr:T9SS type A sorting domain-containing protein [uncultured Polaribacter sp.]
MKKITLLFALLISSIGFSQTPTGAAPTPPARNAADVVSIFSQTSDESTKVYADIAANLNPNWGATSGQVTFPAFGSDRVMQIPAFNYQGIDFDTNRQNISTMTKMHFDVWTNGASPRMVIIWAGGEAAATGSTITSAPGQWTSVDVNLADFTGADLTTVRQLKIDMGDETQTIYLDNIYFYKEAVDPNTDATLSDLKIDGNTIAGFLPSNETYTYKVTGTSVPQVTATASQDGTAQVSITQATAVPGSATVVVTAGDTTTQKTYTVNFEQEAAPTTAAPTPPSYDANNVVSLYSEAYTPSAVISNVGWDDSAFEEVTIAGNKVLKVTGVNFLGMSLDSYVDATSMTHLHMDYWIVDDYTVGQVLNPKLSNHAAQAGETNGIDISNPINNQTEVQNWQSKDFVLNGDRQSIKEFLITVAGKTSKYYLDNVYMYVAGTASVDNNTLLGFSMYPNPANNVLNISAKETIKNADIFNVLGKKVMSVNINKANGSIDVSSLSSGIYLIKYNVNDKVGTAKFIKQ